MEVIYVKGFGEGYNLLFINPKKVSWVYPFPDFTGIHKDLWFCYLILILISAVLIITLMGV